MKKGIVMESGKKWTVILTAQGEFVKIPAHPHHVEGKEVFFHPEAVAADQRKRRKVPRWVSGLSLATAACLLFLVVILPLNGGNSAYAAVTIDINPSLELEVNQNMMVTNVISLDNEAESLLETLEWKDQSLTVVTLRIIELARIKGYMNNEKRVLLTTAYYETEQTQKLQPLLEEVTQSINPEEEITFVIVDGKKEWQEEAKEKQVSPGAYTLTKKAEQQGIELKEEEAQSVKLDRLTSVSGVKVIPPKPKKKDNKPQKKDKDKETDRVEERDEDKDKDKNKDDKDNKRDKEDEDKDKDKDREENEEKENGKARDKVRETEEDKNKDREDRNDQEERGNKKPESDRDSKRSERAEKEAPKKVPPKPHEGKSGPEKGRGSEDEKKERGNKEKDD